MKKSELAGSRKIPVPLDLPDDTEDEDYFGLKTKLSPVDFRCHIYPPQPYQHMNNRTTSQRSTTVSTTSVITTTSTSSSSKKRRRDSNNNMSTTKPPQVTAFHVYDDVAPSTSGVIPSTGDVTVIPGSGEAAGKSNETAVYNTQASHQPEHLDSEHVARPTDWWSNCTSPAVTDGGPQTSTTTTTTAVDDIQQYDDGETPTPRYEDGTYEKLVRSGERRSVESFGYTALQARRTRDSIMTDVSYESIARLTATRCHVAAPITDNNNDDNLMSLRSTAGDYLHPM